MKVRVNIGSRLLHCHACGLEVARGERYIKTVSAGNFHTACLRDAKGGPIIEPKTDLERSREKISLRTVALQPMEGSH